MIPNVFFPAVLLPGVTFGLLFAWPWIERRFTKDHSEHNICDRPREHPVRTSVGVGILMFYIVLFLASATDVLANTFETSLNLVLWTLRIMLFVLPLVAGVVTYLLLREMAQIPSIGEPKIPVEIRRGIDGSFAFAELSVHENSEELHELPEEVAYRALVSGGSHAPGGADESLGEMANDSTDESPRGVFEVPRD